MEQQVTGNAIAVLVMNQNTPTHVVNYLVVSCDFVQPTLHVAGEALRLLGLMVGPIRAKGSPGRMAASSGRGVDAVPWPASWNVVAFQIRFLYCCL